MDLKRQNLLLFIVFIVASCGHLGDTENENSDLWSDPKTWSVEMNNGKYGYVDSIGNIMIDYKFDVAREFEGPLAVVLPSRSNGLMYLIDSSGAKVSEPFDYFDVYKKPYIFGHKKNDVDKDEMYLLDSTGKTIIGPYPEIDVGVKRNTFIVSQPCSTCGYRGKKSALVDYNGEFLTPWFAHLSSFNQKHFYIVQNFENDKSINAVVNFDGEMILDWHQSIENQPETEDFFRIETEKSGWNYKGIIDSNANIIVPMNYWLIEYLPVKDMFWAENKSGSSEVYDLYTGDGTLLKKKYSKKYSLCKGTKYIAFQTSSSTYAYYKQEDDKLVQEGPTFPMKYYSYTSSRKTIFGYGRSTTSGYAMPDFNERRSWFYDKGKFGFLDEDLNKVIPAKFDEVGKFYLGKCEVLIGTDEFYIDTLGNRLNEN